jgi:peptide/nickel transport system permease protein
MRTGSLRSVVAKRLLQLVVTLAIVATINFWLFRVLPGSPLLEITREGRLSAAAVRELSNSFGLDRSIGYQYLVYLTHIFAFNTGLSYSSQEPVTSLLFPALVHTLILVVAAEFLIAVFGIWFGVRAGAKPGSFLDNTIVTTAMGLWSIPTFWAAMLLQLLFAVVIPIFPIFGMQSITAPASGIGHVTDVLMHLVLPAVSLAIVSYGQVVLILRNSMTEMIGEGFVLGIRAKGVRERRVLWGHVVPNAFLPTLTVLVLSAQFLLAGTIQVEVVFSWPGLGLLMVQAVNTRDLPVLEAAFFLIAVVVVVLNLISDLLYAWIDPRIRFR